MVDLFERDAEKLLFNYSRTMSGWVGLARQMNIKSPGEWEKFIRLIRSRGEALGQAQDVIDAKVDRFNFLFRGITGMPLETDPASLYARAARGARDYNFLRIGAAFGFAQLAEIGQMIGTTGFRNVLAHVPALRGMVKRGVDGKLTDQLASEIEDMIAPGVDRLLNMPSTRWDEHGYGMADTGVWSRVDDAVQVAKRVTADVGGLSAATTVFQRMGARAVMQKLLGFAHGAKLTKGQARRLRGMGMSDEMQKRVFEQMRKHATTEPSFVPGGRKLRALNPDRWDDADALDELTFSVHREARRIVQENDIGASTPWLHSTTGKLMTQFRTFMLTAWSKATLHNIHHHDLQAFQLLTTSMFAAGLAYIAQQSINIADKKEREKRLEPAEIAKAAFQRTAVASIGPALFDTTATTLFRTDPQFSFGRSSGLASDLVRGAPVVDLYDRVARAAGIPALIARPDEEFTKREYRNIHGLLPVIGGLAGMRRVGDMLAEELPD